MTLDARPDRDLGAEALAAGGAVLAGLVLVLGASSGRAVLVVAVALLQAALVVAWWLVTRPSWPWTTVLVPVGSALAADLVLARDGGDQVGRAVGVLGLAVLAAITLELFRRGRTHVTASLAAALTGAALVVLLAAWVGQVSGAPASTGDQAQGLVQVGAAAAAAGAAVRLLVSAVVPDAGGLRTVVALVAGVLASVLVATLVVRFAHGDPGAGHAVATGLVCGIVGVLGAGLLPPHRGGWGSVVLTAVLPVVVAAPACLLVIQLLLA